MSIPTNSHGSNHRTPSQKWERCDSHNHGSWILTYYGLPPLFNKHHGTWYCTTLSGTHILMVWITQENDQRPTPSIYITLWQSTSIQIGYKPKSIHSISSSNQWPIRTEKPVDRTIPPIGDIIEPRTLDSMA